MGYFKASPDLFVGLQELNRLIKSLDADGFRKLFSISVSNFGIVQNLIGSFTNFQTQIGTNLNSIKVLGGIAIDNTFQAITFPDTDNIPLAPDSNYYWIKISHVYSSIEAGTVSIDKSGNLVGVGTEFLTILRGLPNNPTRISFPNSSLNTLEYDVVEVIDDNTAILAGDFLTELNLEYEVVGSFTPDIVVPGPSKNPFQYDSCIMTFVLETVLDTPPSLTTDVEFFIARVRNTGSGYNIEDKRSLNLFAGGSGAGIFLPLTGGALTGNLDMGNNRIIDLPAAIASGQPIRYEQLIGLYLLLTGGTMSGDIAMGGHKVSGLAAGSIAGDALRYEQLVGLYLLLTGGTMSGDIAMGTHKITGLGAGVNPADAVRFDQLPVNEAWTDVSSFGGSIASVVGQAKAQYRKENSRVWVRGTVAKSVAVIPAASTVTLFTLPSGYRPHDELRVPIVAVSVNSDNIFLWIKTDGTVNIVTGTNTIGIGTPVYLGEFTFSTDGSTA